MITPTGGSVESTGKSSRAAVSAATRKVAPARAEAELKEVRAQIDKVRAELQRDAGRRDKLTRELEETEKTVSSARGELERRIEARLHHETAEPRAIARHLLEDLLHLCDDLGRELRFAVGRGGESKGHVARRLPRVGGQKALLEHLV